MQWLECGDIMRRFQHTLEQRQEQKVRKMLLIPSETFPSTARLNWELLAVKYHRISWYWLIETLTSRSLPKSIQSQQLPTTSREKTLLVLKMPTNMGDNIHPEKTKKKKHCKVSFFPPGVVEKFTEALNWMSTQTTSGAAHSGMFKMTHAACSIKQPSLYGRCALTACDREPACLSLGRPVRTGW